MFKPQTTLFKPQSTCSQQIKLFKVISNSAGWRMLAKCCGVLYSVHCKYTVQYSTVDNFVAQIVQLIVFSVVQFLVAAILNIPLVTNRFLLCPQASWQFWTPPRWGNSANTPSNGSSHPHARLPASSGYSAQSSASSR